MLVLNNSLVDDVADGHDMVSNLATRSSNRPSEQLVAIRTIHVKHWLGIGLALGAGYRKPSEVLSFRQRRFKVEFGARAIHWSLSSLPAARICTGNAFKPSVLEKHAHSLEAYSSDPRLPEGHPEQIHGDLLGVARLLPLGIDRHRPKTATIYRHRHRHRHRHRAEAAQLSRHLALRVTAVYCAIDLYSPGGSAKPRRSASSGG
mmetsp:Transcript_63579/g.170130  ORF Transcript_63579/g.170130 Transcript_63579/m.170130 type:complete len:204 (+) Transcript_63579:1261-1872(+)